MKRLFCAVLSATMMLAICFVVFAGCGGNPTLYATFETPTNLPTGVAGVKLVANGTTSYSDDSQVYYDLLPNNGDATGDVHLEIYVEPRYAVKAVTFTIEAEDGSWTETVSDLSEEYAIYEQGNPTDIAGAEGEYVCYKTISMPTFVGKSGNAKASVPVLQVEDAQYDLHTGTLWDENSDHLADGNETEPAVDVKGALEMLTFTVTRSGKTPVTYNWDEFNQNVIGKDEKYGYGDTFKLKIQYPAGTDLRMTSGGCDFAILHAEAGEDSAVIEMSRNLVEEGWIVRAFEASQDEEDLGENKGGFISEDKHTSASFVYSLTDRTAEWTFKVMRKSKITFNKYRLYETIQMCYLDIINQN